MSNNYQSIFTLPKANITIDPSWGILRLEILSSKPQEIIFKMLGNCVLGNEDQGNQSSEEIALNTPYVIQSLGNTPLGNIKITAEEGCVIVAYK